MENVTEELVRQNGNQAAVVMADYAGQGGGGGGNGVVVQDGNIVSGIHVRQATEEDVAKFSQGSVAVGDYVLDINGTIPYVLVLVEGGVASVYLLTRVSLEEHSAYYVENSITSPDTSATFTTYLFIVSDDVTLLTPFRQE